MEVVSIVAELLGPLVLASEDRAHLRYLLDELGQTTDVDDALFTRYQQLVPIEQLLEISDLAQALVDPDGELEPGEIVGQLIPLTEVVLQALTDLANLGTEDVAGLIAPLDDPDTWRDLALALPEYLLGRFLADYHPVLAASLALLGTLRRVVAPSDQVADDKHLDVLDLESVGALLAGPANHLSAEYGWGGEFDYPTFANRLEALILATGRKVGRRPGADGFDELDLALVDGVTAVGGYAQLVLTMSAALDGGGQPDGVAVSTSLLGSLASAEVGDVWTLSNDGLLAGTEVAIRPDGPVLTGGSGIGFTLTGAPIAPWVLVGSADATRLELSGASITATADADDVSLVAQLGNGDASGLRLVLAAAETDSFLSALLSADVTVDLGLAVGWSWSGGISFGGSIGFEVTIPIYRTLGFIEIGTVTVALSADGVVVTAFLSSSIGPVAASVDGLGVRMLVTPTTDGGTGALGSYELAFAIEPPHGVGIGLDLGVVSGGGYLDIDVEAGSYAGVLDLEVLAVGISAVAIIDTKLPDVDGWSMFFALFLDLPSIQLGFGFTLEGVGGVAGINRAIDTDALGSAVRSGSLDTILFPPDPIADAPIIIEEFRAIFPPADGSYVFGPIVKIGWGTPALIEAELGIIIQLPDPLVLVVLGSLSAVLPSRDLELVALNLDVAGVIDFEAGTLAIDASLHDSHVVGFALSGDMALRAEFGNAQAFLMSVGGFHPRFDPPGDFPDLRPVTFGIKAGSVLRIDFMSYFALTSNSVQCGADFTLDADVMGFGVYGSCGFDALIQFSPFMVITSVDFEVSITAAGVDLMGVMLYASVEGPNPWHVIGTARFEVLGFGKDIRVDELIGSRDNEPPVEAADVLAELVGALEVDDAWRVIEASDTAVTLRDIDDPNAPLFATPDSIIEVRQTVVPLGISIEQYGNAPVGEHSNFDLVAVGLDQSASLDDWFAPGQFFELGNDDKLEGPEFELMRSGLQFGGGAPAFGPNVVVDTGYVAYTIDPEFEVDDGPWKGIVQSVLGVPMTAHTQSGFTAVQTEMVATTSAAYVIVDDSGSTISTTTTWSAAYAASAGSIDLHIERQLEGVLE